MHHSVNAFLESQRSGISRLSKTNKGLKSTEFLTLKKYQVSRETEKAQNSDGQLHFLVFVYIKFEIFWMQFAHQFAHFPSEFPKVFAADFMLTFPALPVRVSVRWPCSTLILKWLRKTLYKNLLIINTAAMTCEKELKTAWKSHTSHFKDEHTDEVWPRLCVCVCAWSLVWGWEEVGALKRILMSTFWLAAQIWALDASG